MAAAQADLKVTAAFDQAQYPPESDLPITVTLENVGDAVATEVRFYYDHSTVWIRHGSEDVQRSHTVAPGERLVFPIVARQFDRLSDEAVFVIRAFEPNRPDPTPADNEVTTRARVPQDRGSLEVVVYTDANGDGRFDTGEAVAGLVFNASGGAPGTSLSATTDRDGRVAFTNVPTGEYRIYFVSDDVVVAPGFGTVTVTADTTVRAEIPTAAPVSRVLSAQVRLDKDTYGRGEAVTVTVTLTNSGATALTNVIARCNPPGDPWHLDGTGPGWAPLAINGPGVRLEAGETKSFAIPDVVTAAAYDVGRLIVECQFGNNGWQLDGYAEARDIAEVVGARSNAEGLLSYYPGQGDNRPLPDVRLLALDRTSGAVVAEARSGPDGSWRFTDLPVGTYRVLVLGPYKNRYGGDFHIQVRGGATSTNHFVVVDGPLVTEPPSTPGSGSTAPAGQPQPEPPADGGGGADLADTGADTTGPLLLGALLLALGLATNLAARRRLR